ncbi:hypothetical protein BSLG_007167 [Batrachochytrium salamandrivorans]|nr:hypothetical protein BSLG_007167 [Batrachochytrium salamandrivorans]
MLKNDQASLQNIYSASNADSNRMSSPFTTMSYTHNISSQLRHSLQSSLLSTCTYVHLPSYPLSGFSFGAKDPQPEEDPTIVAKLIRLQSEYEVQGMRTSVEGVLLVHEHGHPHILMLQVANSYYRLPGGILKPGEDEVEGLKLRINQKLAPIGHDQTSDSDFDVGELIGVWWRPNVESIMRPKEMRKIYLIHLPEKMPKNMKLLAVPLFELYDNAARYGPHLTTLPHLLSRFNFVSQ